ncbi:MAG: histidinol phosphate phosphatase [Gemmatimonadaceae bacterium]|nr:histidinol phosphate phosphatase [Gemmatimonadaceae bacterium]
MSATLLRSAETLARHIGTVALRHYRSILTVETKGDGSPVTAADREAETAARTWLSQHFPEDGVLGEERGEQEGRSGRRWIIDPIDGTKSFVRGVPLWGSLVALVEGEEVLAGAAFFPAVDELVAAAPGEGCWWNGNRASVSRCSTLAGATMLINDERGFTRAALREGWRTLSGEANLVRGWGDCFGYLLVATGRAEVMVDPVVNPWDTACFQPIIEEAGGVFTDLKGRRTAFAGSAIATNASLAEQVREYFEG